MRLWHEALISKLPRQQLLGQWRECIALLGLGWGKKHKTVNYVFSNPTENLVKYTNKISKEMIRRGYKPNTMLIEKALSKRLSNNDIRSVLAKANNNVCCGYGNGFCYKEHNDFYLSECLENLRSKGIVI